jgi:hypothetical protein
VSSAAVERQRAVFSAAKRYCRAKAEYKIAKEISSVPEQERCLGRLNREARYLEDAIDSWYNPTR